jgi:putative RNA 2'-phosphotransferase
MTEQQRAKISKRLSYILRHAPESVGLELDEHGWASVKDLMIKFGDSLNIETLQEVVETNEKKRFAFNEDFKKIRANQGHSIAVDLAYEPCAPPDFLFHGTAKQFLDSIKAQGLIKGSRHHVHLSDDELTAKKVGSRHGSPHVLTIKSKEMYEAGFTFYISDNGVWLTENVPNHFIIC